MLSVLLNSSLKKRVKNVTVMNIYGVTCTNEENSSFVKNFKYSVSEQHNFFLITANLCRNMKTSVPQKPSL